MTSLDVYHTSEGIVAAMLAVTNVIVLATDGYADKPAYKREIYLAKAKKCSIVTVGVKEVDDQDNFCKEKQQADKLQVQYTTNTDKHSILFNEFSLESLYDSIKKRFSSSKSTFYIYVSYSKKDARYAKMLQKTLEQLQTSKSSTEIKCRIEENDRNIEFAEKIIFKPEIAAVVLILTPAYLDDQICLHEAKFAHYCQTPIIPTVWEPMDYPPTELKPFLSNTFTDFSKIALHEPDKLNYRVQAIKKLAQDAANSVPFGNFTDTNFVVKNVGAWDEGDVCNWLRYINLSIYCQNFVSKHVNGSVLLSLTQEDLKNDFKMSSLHQKVVLSEIEGLFTAISWDNEQVLEWIQKISLSDIYEKLRTDGSINGKALLVLTDEVLEMDYKIESASSRKRFLIELELLKLQSAKVSMSDQYRYTLLKDIIVPVGTDQYNIFRFHPDIKHLFADIIENIKDSDFGLLQTGFKKFLFIITVLAYEYSSNFNRCKFMWFDGNKIELAAIRFEYLKAFLSKSNDEQKQEYNGQTFLKFDQLYLLMQALTDELRSRIKGEKPRDIDKSLQSSVDAVCSTAEHASLMDIFTLDTNSVKFVRAIWLQYVFIENIANELFPIFDRSVNGYLSLGELLSGLDVILFGTTTDRVKVAFSAADFNDDGYLGPEEVTRFYEKMFKEPFLLIKESKVLQDFPMKRQGDTHTVESYVFNLIQDALDPTLPVCLNTELILTYFGNTALESYGDRQLNETATVILTPDGRPLNFSPATAIYFSFKLRKTIFISNIYLKGSEKAAKNNAKYFRRACVWLCSKECAWDTLLPIKEPNDTVTQFLDIELRDGEYSYKNSFEEQKEANYIYVHLPPHPDNKLTALEFFGIWGFRQKQDQYTPYQDTQALFVRAGGILQHNETANMLSGVSIADSTVAYFGFANEYADSATISCANATESQEILKHRMEDLTSSMSYLRPKKGNASANQVQILHDVLPFVHLLLILRGQSLESVLESTL